MNDGCKEIMDIVAKYFYLPGLRLGWSILQVVDPTVGPHAAGAILCVLRKLGLINLDLQVKDEQLLVREDNNNDDINNDNNNNNNDNNYNDDDSDNNNNNDINIGANNNKIDNNNVIDNTTDYDSSNDNDNDNDNENENSNDIDNNNTTDNDDDININNVNNIHNNSNTIKDVWTTDSSTHAFPNVTMKTYQESIMESFLKAEAGVAAVVRMEGRSIEERVLVSYRL